jgi:hypothetical protein
MNPTDKMKEELQTTQKAAITLPSFKMNFVKKSKEFMRLLKEGQFDKIKQELLQYQSQNKKELDEFFNQCGFSILYWTIFIQMDNPSLSFLHQLQKEGILNSKILKELLHNDNDSLLNSLMHHALRLEKSKQYNEQFQINLLGTLKLLLEIDYEGVAEFMKKSESADFMTQQAKTVFQSALAQHHHKINSKSSALK